LFCANQAVNLTRPRSTDRFGSGHHFEFKEVQAHA
jgi:hypothetical protein